MNDIWCLLVVRLGFPPTQPYFLQTPTAGGAAVADPEQCSKSHRVGASNAPGHHLHSPCLSSVYNIEHAGG